MHLDPKLLALTLLGACALQAAPLRPVAWNGKPGAVSFTFDDNCASQIANVLPSLKSRGLHATFFVTGGFSSSAATWKQAALDGNELGNHTVSHKDLSGMDSAKATQEIANQAATLRALDPSVEALSLAYPYCNTSELVDRITARENLIARTCGGSARFPWKSAPSNWMRMTSFIVTDDATAAAALTGIDAAARDSSWFVTLNHGIGGDWMYITPIQLDSMFDRAKGRDLWIGTYQEVAAYWRAAKVLDTVTATPASQGWTLSWLSPHPKMPRSVPVRIRLDTVLFGASPRLLQGGNEIVRERDGSWLVDFMKRSLQVLPAAPTGIPETDPSRGLRSRRTAEGLRLDGIPGAGTWSARSLDGRLVGHGSLSPDRDGSQLLELDAGGILFLTIHTAMGTRTVRIDALR